jgi:hypothetical protein
VPPSSRALEADIVKKARQHAEEDRPEMLQHLPAIYHYQQSDEPTSEFQELFFGKFSDKTGEDNVLRIMVQEELTPITKLKDTAQLAQVFRGIFECMLLLHASSSPTISSTSMQAIVGSLRRPKPCTEISVLGISCSELSMAESAGS